MEIRPQPLEVGPLVERYLNGKDVAALYAGDPRESATFLRHAERVMERFDAAARRRAAGCLRAPSPAAEQRLSLWVESGGMVVTTGQQAGLFGGPLYTIYKALTVARHAAEFETLLGVPVLPVFWIASEDHDWDEVNHALLPDLAAGELLRCQLQREGEGHAMARTALDGGLEEALETVRQLTAGEPFGSDVLRLLRERYRVGKPMSEAFADFLAELFAPHGIFLADAAAPPLKHASLAVLRRALEDRAGEAAVGTDSARLEQAGYAAQVAVVPDAPLLFHHGEGGRQRLLRTPRGLRTDNGTERPLPSLLDELEGDPGRFSPNVHLRPVVESAIFPVLAYVGGPAELAYFAQIGGLFRTHGMEPPPVLPRASFLLVPEEADARLRRLRLDVEELRSPEAEIAQRLLRRRLPGAALAAIEQLRADVVAGYRDLIEGADADPPLRLALGSQRNAALATVERAERKLLRDLRRREVRLLDDLRAARTLLRPDGAPQDRVHNIVPYLAREGEVLLQRLLEGIAPPAATRVSA